MSRKTITRSTGAALVAAGLVLGASVPALASTGSASTEWEQDASNWGQVHSATIAEHDLARLEAAGVSIDNINLINPERGISAVEIEWSLIPGTPFPEQLKPSDYMDGTPADPANPWDSASNSLMLGVRGMSVYEQGKFPAGAPAGTFSQHVPLDYIFNGHADGTVRFSAASLSSWRPGADYAPAPEYSWNIDQYQTFDPAREAAAEALGFRGHYVPNLSECYDADNCGIWIQPAAYGFYETEFGGTSGMLTLTDPVWVSVHTTAGLKTPTNYTDEHGRVHTFTVANTAPGGVSNLSDTWHTPEGFTEDGRVHPKMTMLHPYMKGDVIYTGVNTTVGTTQQFIGIGENTYRMILTPNVPLGDLSWDFDWSMDTPYWVFPEDGGDARVVTVSTEVVGDEVVITMTVTAEDGVSIPELRANVPFLNVHAGGVPLHEHMWMTPGYVQTVEGDIGDPTPFIAPLSFEVVVINEHGGTLAPEDIDITFTGETDEGDEVTNVSAGFQQNHVAPGYYEVATPSIAGYTHGSWQCGGIGWFGEFSESEGWFDAEAVYGVTNGAGLDCIRTYVQEATPVDPPVVEPPVVEPPVTEPPVVEPPVEEPPVYNPPFRPETGVEAAGITEEVSTGTLAAIAALLAMTGVGLLVRSRRLEN